MSRSLAICVDDIGLVAGTAATALHLGEGARVCAASCVTNGRHWAADSSLLEAATRIGQGGKLELGLHFNLTEGAPLSASLASRWPTLPRLGWLMAMAHLGQLPAAAIAAEWHAQHAAFVDRIGRQPDFIDGHQHVHHLPGVRDVVLSGASQLGPRPAIRSTGHVVGPEGTFKRLVIEASGGSALALELRSRGIRHNDALLGTYDLVAGRYRALMQGWLRALPTRGSLLYCHPCFDASHGPEDAARREEAAYLSSTAFSDDLAAAQVTVGPAWQTGARRSMPD